MACFRVTAVSKRAPVDSSRETISAKGTSVQPGLMLTSGPYRTQTGGGRLHSAHSNSPGNPIRAPVKAWNATQIDREREKERGGSRECLWLQVSCLTKMSPLSHGLSDRLADKAELWSRISLSACT